MQKDVKGRTKDANRTSKDARRTHNDIVTTQKDVACYFINLSKSGRLSNGESPRDESHGLLQLIRMGREKVRQKKMSIK